MRTAFHLFIWIAFTLIAPTAYGQGASTIEPYEILYGRPLGIHPRLSAQKMVPSAGTLALVQARTDALLARVSSVSAALGPSPKAASLKDLAKTVHEEESEAVKLRDRGKHYAAWHKASLDFVEIEFLVGFVEAVAKEALQDTSGGHGSLSKLPELRARLDQFYTRLQLTRPSSVSVALALTAAYTDWVDATSLLDLVQNRPAELLGMLEPHLGPTKAEHRDKIVRWFLEPIAVPLLQWCLEDAELRLQSSQADPISVIQPSEAELRRLAQAYARAARANLTLAESLIEGRTLPTRTSEQQVAGRFGALLIAERLDYVRVHQKDFGMPGMLANLGVSAAAYRASLNVLAELHVLTAPQVASASGADAVAAAVAQARTIGMQLEELRVLDSAAQAQAALGHVPTPVLLAYQRAQELHEGDAEDQELAQIEQIESTVMAQLAAGLSSPAPRQSFPIDDNGPNVGAEPTREDYVLACIERLRFSELASAKGFLVNKAPRMPEFERDNLIEAALVEACLRARDLRSSVRPYFFEMLRNDLAQWYREVEIFERNAPRLTTTCTGAPSALEGLLGHEQCTLLQQAMGALPDELRELMELRYYKKLSEAEIAQQRGCSERTVRRRLNQSLELLREFFKKQDPSAFSLRLSVRALGWLALWAPYLHTPAAAERPKCLNLGGSQEI